MGDYTYIDPHSGEEWRAVVGYEGSYWVSDLGNVCSTNKYLKPLLGNVGYYNVVLSFQGKTKRFNIHRLVAEAFLPRPQGAYQVHHIDGSRTNNKLSNLRWGDHKQNAVDSIKHGTMQRGENHYLTSFTEEDVRRIRADARRPKVIAADLGVARATIENIQKRVTWRHVV